MRLLKYFLHIFFYPVIFLILILKKYKFIKFAKVDTTRLGHSIRNVEGFLIATNFYKYSELTNCKIIFFLGLPSANQQTVKIIKRLIPIYGYSFFFNLVQRSLIYWNKKEHIISMNDYTYKNLSLKHNDISKFYKKPFVYFTKEEKEMGVKLIKNIGLKKK